jgi:hypothetical protein
MTRFFDWSMRNGAQILFGASLLILLVALGPYLVALLHSMSRGSGNEYEPLGVGFRMVAFFTALFTAINSAALPFLGAVLITVARRFVPSEDRIDA